MSTILEPKVNIDSHPPDLSESFGLGRRRRRVVRIVKKKLPTVFTCPRCGEEAVRVTIDKQTGHATVLCAENRGMPSLLVNRNPDGFFTTSRAGEDCGEFLLDD